MNDIVSSPVTPAALPSPARRTHAVTVPTSQAAPSVHVLYDADRDGAPVLIDLDTIRRRAAETLDQYARFNIHSLTDMVRAAVGLDMRLRQLLAALDAEPAEAPLLESSAPETFTSADGTVWVQRAVDRDGRGPYALDGVTDCPQYLMAPLAELVESGPTLRLVSPGALAEQRHQYLDLDPDSACCPPGFTSPACLPREVTQ